MKLTKIDIENFRSIKKESIVFREDCLALIGLNESGKSNILNAIRAFDSEFNLTSKDRSKITGEYPTISFYFQHSKEELEQIQQIIQASIDGFTLGSNLEYSTSYPKDLVIYRGYEYKEGELESVLYYDYKLSLSLKRQSEWIHIDASKVQPEEKLMFQEIEHELSGKELVEKSLLTDVQLGYQKQFDIASLESIIDKPIMHFLAGLIPNIRFWQYEPMYLLPSELVYEELIKNDDPIANSAPLFNILMLTKELKIGTVEDLKTKISRWKDDSSERRKDSRLITDNLNRYIKNIWADYDQDIYIELEESKITIHVNDPLSSQNNFYDMEARSQGFKTFISFMLTTAAEVENGRIKNCILLLDEPETHLHPSGARYMREELLKLSLKGNLVIYATHSIFMVDRNNLYRHVIVSKQNEHTIITPVERNNFIQEAVLYEAMGTQIDEFSIGTKNIVFEGGLDLKVFEFLVHSCLDKGSYKEVYNFEYWDGGGVRRIDQFVSNKILPKNSIWYFILDNDSPGVNLAKNLNAKVKDNGNVVFRTCHYSEKVNAELEDILPKRFSDEAIMHVIETLGLSNGFDHGILSAQKLVSETTAEIKKQLGLDRDRGILFEQTFKEIFDKIVSEELAQMKLQFSSKKERLDKFKFIFEDYYHFYMTFFEKTFSK